MSAKSVQVLCRTFGQLQESGDDCESQRERTFSAIHQARTLHGHGITDGAAPKEPYLRGIESACTVPIDPTFYGMATFANRCPRAVRLVRKPQLERNMLERYVHLRAVVVRRSRGSGVFHCQAWHVFERRHLSISAWTRQKVRLNGATQVVWLYTPLKRKKVNHEG
jgi:hypothetical protein